MKRIRRLINRSKTLDVKQIKKLKVWEEQHPTYLENEELLGEWHCMLGEIVGGGGEAERDKNKEQIKKTISGALEWRDALSSELPELSALAGEVNKKIKLNYHCIVSAKCSLI